MFDFSDSLNDVAPVSPILLTVCEKRKKERIVDGCLLRVFFCVFSFVFTTQIKCSKCCV